MGKNVIVDIVKLDVSSRHQSATQDQHIGTSTAHLEEVKEK